MKRAWGLIPALLLLASCASGPPPVPVKGRIGVAVLAAPNPQQLLLGAPRYPNKVTALDANWDLPAMLVSQVAARAGPRFEVVPVTPTRHLLEADSLLAGHTPPHLDASYISDLGRLRDAAKLDLLLVLAPYTRQPDTYVPGIVRGYGVVTRCGALSCNSTVFDYLRPLLFTFAGGPELVQVETRRDPSQLERTFGGPAETPAVPAADLAQARAALAAMLDEDLGALLVQAWIPGCVGEMTYAERVKGCPPLREK